YSTSHALRIEELLKQQGIPNKLIPVPRHIGSDCGVCVRVAADLEADVKQVVCESGIEIQGIFT
ncbi:MAG: DUF3343 domain-containing protein, partial [Anaerolineales bacterium]|nr:DUF3343 domain-containing protein [Anaerolineales bacterium]